LVIWCVSSKRENAQIQVKEEVMVSLTDSAVSKFKEVVEKQGADGDGVRIFVVPGG
jgi:hypothetical protein